MSKTINLIEIRFQRKDYPSKANKEEKGKVLNCISKKIKCQPINYHQIDSIRNRS